MIRSLFRILRRLLLVSAFCGIAGVLIIVATMGYVVSRYDGTAELPADCAIVFGAAVHSVDNPGPGIVRRVETAARLYGEGLVGTLYLSGGKGREGQDSEAQVMREVAVQRGVDPADVVLETQATSTWENLLFTRPLMASCGSVVGISDRYHLARIDYLAEAQGWGSLQTHPADRVATRPFEFRSLAREALALLYYSVMHRTLEKDAMEALMHFE